MRSYRMQFKPKDAKNSASFSVKKYSKNLSKKKSYFSCPSTFFTAFLMSLSWPG